MKGVVLCLLNIQGYNNTLACLHSLKLTSLDFSVSLTNPIPTLTLPARTHGIYLYGTNAQAALKH